MDPAELHRQRRQKVERLLSKAEALEVALPDAPGQTYLVLANNLRLQAICEHLGLRVPEDENQEETDGGTDERTDD